MRTAGGAAIPRADDAAACLPRWLQPYTLATAAAIMALLVLIVFPITRMLVNTFVPGGAFNSAVFVELAGEPWLVPVLVNTVIAVGVSTVFAVLIGAVLAWLNERTDANLGIFGTVLPVVPLLMPSVALTIGWVFIAAPNVGLLNGLLVWLFGPEAIQVNIYTWTGLIVVYTIHGVPYAYLVVSAAIRNLDPALEEASRVSGAGLLRTLFRVSLPATMPAIVASTLLVVISGIGTYSIPAIIATTAQIGVLPTQIVKLLTKDYPPHLGEAQILGFIMLLVVVAFWMVQRHMTASGQYGTIGGRASGSSRLPLGLWRIPARLAMGFYLASASLIPLAALLLVSIQRFWTPKINPAQFTLHHFEQVLFVNRVTFAAFKHSLLLSGTGATIAMVIAALTALYAAVNASAFSKFVDLVVKSPATIPNLVVSLAFLTTFSGAPFFLSGTLTILLIAFIVMYIPPGSIAAGSAVGQVGRDLREASYIAGANEGRTMRRIVIPLALPGFAAGWTLVFIHMMGDLSASALLAGVKTPVIGFAILTIWETGSFGLLAAFSAIMCLINAAVVGLMAWLVRRLTIR